MEDMDQMDYGDQYGMAEGDMMDGDYDEEDDQKVGKRYTRHLLPA